MEEEIDVHVPRWPKAFVVSHRGRARRFMVPKEHTQTMLVQRAADALADRPGDSQLRQELCDLAYGLVCETLTIRARRLLPWYRRSNLEDILQETFYNFFQTLIRLAEARRINRTMDAAAYLKTIAINQLMDEVTKDTRRTKLLHEVTKRLAEHATLHSAQLEDAGLSEDIEKSLRKLSPPDQSLIRLRIFNDLSYKEIGATLNITANAAKVRFHRAIARLRAEVASRSTAE